MPFKNQNLMEILIILSHLGGLKYLREGIPSF